MISINNIPLDIQYIPTEWIFEFYCNLNFKLTGQSVIVKSIFNEEKTPSMRIFVIGDIYVFKDFSSGKGGSGLDLVSELFSLNKSESSFKIKKDYDNWLVNNNYQKKELVIEKFKLKNYKLRGWNIYDKQYWTQFNIDSKI